MLSMDFARTKTRYWYDFSSANDEKVADTVLNPNQAGGTGIYLGKLDKIKNTADAGISMATLVGGTYDPDEGDSIRLHKKLLCRNKRY